MVRNNSYDCSSCGYSYTVKSMNPMLLVCPKCNSTIQDLTGERLSTSFIQADWSFIKISTRGEWKNQGFQVIGRAKFQLLNGYLNAWYLLYTDNSSGWLFDWLGKLAIATTTQYQIDFKEAQKLAPGKRVRLRDRTCDLISMDECERLMYEGEIGLLPFYRPPIFLCEGLLYNEIFVFFMLNIPKEEIIYFEAEKATVQNLKTETLLTFNDWR
jgi:hypothetical protein